MRYYEGLQQNSVCVIMKGYSRTVCALLRRVTADQCVRCYEGLQQNSVCIIMKGYSRTVCALLRRVTAEQWIPA